MVKRGMDVRVLGLLTSSDYSSLPFNEYRILQQSIGRECAEIIFETFAEEGFKVNFSATVYEIANELLGVATHLMFGSELKLLDIKYRLDEDLCFLNITIKRCPICNFIDSSAPVCNLLSAFFGRLIELLFSRFAQIKVGYKEESCIAAGDPDCSFTITWRTPVGLPLPEKHVLEIHIDEKALKEKVSEIEKLDFYKKVVKYARQRVRAS